jgi:hypothetical protein
MGLKSPTPSLLAALASLACTLACMHIHIHTHTPPSHKLDGVVHTFTFNKLEQHDWRNRFAVSEEQVLKFSIQSITTRIKQS